MNPKLLHDALMMIDRDLKAKQSRLTVTQTDVSDSDEGFARRLGSVTDRLADVDNEIKRLALQRAALVAEAEQMTLAREFGHEIIPVLRQEIKQLESKQALVKLHLIAEELKQ
jgi:hypothetical protein